MTINGVSLTLGNTYAFNTINATILGDQYNNLKLLGIISIDEALKYSDVATIWQQLKSADNTLPNKDAKFITYYLFTNSDNKKIVMGREWIDEDTFTAVTEVNTQITIFGIPTNMETLVVKAITDLVNNKIEVKRV